MAVLYGNDALSILLISTKKTYSGFLKKVFVFQEICFKDKILKTFKISADCRIKTCRSLKRRAILKILSNVFRRAYALSIGFKIKPLTKSNFECQDKNQRKFCCKAWQKKQPFVFTVYLINHIFQASVLLIRDNRMYRT